MNISKVARGLLRKQKGHRLCSAIYCAYFKQGVSLKLSLGLKYFDYRTSDQRTSTNLKLRHVVESRIDMIFLQTEEDFC